MELEVLLGEGGQNCQILLPASSAFTEAASALPPTPTSGGGGGCSPAPLLFVILWDPWGQGQGIGATVPWQEVLSAVWLQSLLLQEANSLA